MEFVSDFVVAGMILADEAFFECVGLLGRAEDRPHGVVVAAHSGGIGHNLLETVIPRLEVAVHGLVDAIGREADVDDFPVLLDDVDSGMVAGLREGCAGAALSFAWPVGWGELVDFHIIFR